jgi:hypothetical protein
MWANLAPVRLDEKYLFSVLQIVHVVDQCADNMNILDKENTEPSNANFLGYNLNISVKFLHFMEAVSTIETA